MGLINAYAFTSIISNYRLCWIGGKFGGHKTSLAFYIAKQYLDNGYRLISNTRSVWSDKIEDTELSNGKLKAVIILDEGGLEFKATRQVETIAAYARKMDCIYLIPSFWAPVRSAQVLTCQPLFSFQSAGLPLIIYKWRVRIGAFTDQGFFGWWNPKEIYGIYSSKDPGDTASEIIEFLVKRTKEYRESFGYDAEDGLPEMEVTSEDLLQEAASTIAEAADNLISIPKRRRGKGKIF